MNAMDALTSSGRASALYARFRSSDLISSRFAAWSLAVFKSYRRDVSVEL